MISALSITTIVPVYNGQRYLGEALASILDQAGGCDEVLVLDDGSTDSSAALARAVPGVRVEILPHRGKSAALNDGIRLAKGEWLAFLDADDVWLAGKLAAQRAAVANAPNLEAVFTHAEEFVSPDLDEADASRLRPAPGAMPGYSVSTALLRRSLFDRVGLLEEHVAVGEFVEWMARARDAGIRECLLEPVFLRRRLHASNLGRGEGGRPAHLLPMLRQVIARRRAQRGGDGSAGS